MFIRYDDITNKDEYFSYDSDVSGDVKRWNNKWEKDRCYVTEDNDAYCDFSDDKYYLMPDDTRLSVVEGNYYFVSKSVETDGYLLDDSPEFEKSGVPIFTHMEGEWGKEDILNYREWIKSLEFSEAVGGSN